MEWLLGGLGLVILLLAGDALVKGAVNLSLRLGIPALIVSLTIVAFGTSAPELLISVKAMLDGAPGLAMGNVVGSNTANILLVLGVPALLTSMHTGACETRKTYLFMIGGSVLFILLCFLGPLIWWHGLILLAVLAGILGNAFFEARAHRNGADNVEEELEGVDPDMSWSWIFIYLVLGLVGLPIGADLLVDSAVHIARVFGISETVIGLTLVAIGTSLPELATSVMAALRKQADVVLGNVIGSNMFNLLAIMGVATMVGPIPVDPEFLSFDLWVMLAASLLLVPFVFFGKDIGRLVGIVFIALYGIYLSVLIM
ncbi:cation:H+ antiporter [Poseidonocella pacifica]|uniref:Cation:H+ antiporter n=1 Tax=Poseidonocella pacifica TaxID=871651 RepID=A0A1I0XE78_9RHOB|nr:calcium/sodium antiporter [Poseidonocella pacifica]SFA98620.1 cation:H+ antiporter [Poseidonocella pacifica]